MIDFRLYQPHISNLSGSILRRLTLIFAFISPGNAGQSCVSGLELGQRIENLMFHLCPSDYLASLKTSAISNLDTRPICCQFYSIIVNSAKSADPFCNLAHIYLWSMSHFHNFGSFATNS